VPRRWPKKPRTTPTFWGMVKKPERMDSLYSIVLCQNHLGHPKSVSFGEVSGVANGQ